MDKTLKYARQIMDAMEKHASMFGGPEAVELQYLLALDFLALAQGLDTDHVRTAWHVLLDDPRTGGPSSLALSDRDMDVFAIVSFLKEIRDEIDVDVEVVRCLPPPVPSRL